MNPTQFKTRFKIRYNSMGAILALALLTPTLSGCLFGAAAAVTAGSLAALDRRTVGTQVEEKTLQLKAETTIRERFGSSVHVNAEVYNRQLVLMGQAPDETTKANVEAAVATQPNIRMVVNDIQVGPLSSVGSRANDALITSKVKASLVNAQDVFANAISVASEAGSVYLMGLVTEREANRAAQIAAGVAGVVRVVKVFEIISEEELSRLTATPTGGVRTEGPR